MTNRSIIALIAIAVAIFLVTQTFYTVDPTKQVLVRQFGAIVGDPKTEPGLYAKIPLVQDIQRIDRRLLDYEAEEFEIIAGDQKRLVVDAYARYKITAAKLFAQTVPGGEAALRGLLDSLINSEIRGVLSSVPLHAVLTDRRESLMDEITKRVNAKTKELGVETVDVRIKRADLPQANSQGPDSGEQGWRPIGTAPVNTPVLVRVAGQSEPVVAICDGDRCWQVTWTGDLLSRRPIRWLPIPDPNG